jgi:hypothetical protein
MLLCLLKPISDFRQKLIPFHQLLIDYWNLRVPVDHLER